MTDKKEQTMLELASDDSAMQLLKSIAHNWEVAASRMDHRVLQLAGDLILLL